MAHEETAWTPRGADETYKGYEVWDHGVWPPDLNHGEVDGDLTAPDDGDD